MQIWSSIDVMDYKQAAVLYLTAKHIVSKLCLESVVVTHKKSVLSVSLLCLLSAPVIFLVDIGNCYRLVATVGFN